MQANPHQGKMLLENTYWRKGRVIPNTMIELHRIEGTGEGNLDIYNFISFSVLGYSF